MSLDPGINMVNDTIVGVDIGGTHVTAAIIDLQKRVVVAHSLCRVSIDARGSTETLLTCWAEVIRASIKSCPINTLRIGIAIPGPFDYEKGISLIREQDKFRALYGLDLKKELAQHLAVRSSDIRFFNDAASFLQGEVFGGAAREFSSVVGLTLGTGLGAAVYSNGVSEDAALWHSSFKEGIAEDYLSTRWFLHRFEELSGRRITGVKDISLQVGENQKARQVFTEFGQNLGEFLVPVLETNTPEAVVIGGNIAQSFELFSVSLKSILPSSFSHVIFRKAALGEKATLLGAGSWVARQ